MSDFSKPYTAKEHEDRIYERWMESGYFTPENLPDAKNRKPFTMILPPPNATGTLHIGHAVMLAIQDTLIRFWRMRGRKTLWLPGADHAAIATQEKVEKELYKKEKKTRHDLGREEFLHRVDAFVEESRSTIKTQIRKMGCSLDWTREAFTMDAQRSLAVRTAFVRMYDAGLIYRGHRIVNWDPKLQTTVSDDEIEWMEEKTPFYYLKYGPFTIGTARPETKFGDKYVVMHPDDERYKQYKHGQTIDLEWIGGPITATVIKDRAIDPEFGTGVMTITPWHDTADFDIAERHKLNKEQIIDLQGKLLPIAGAFAGEHVTKARPKIVEKLKEKGLIEKVDENYIHRIAIDSRGGGTIEPQILEQWFISVSAKLWSVSSNEETTLKEMMQRVVENGQITILPKRFEKIYFHWINNLRDWCISRQLWYGHRIPVWYCVACGKNAKNEQDLQKCTRPIVSIEDLTACPHCGGAIRQDPDTLDTWFSSGLWTFSTLGYPEKTNDLEQYHPTDVLETGYDILFFWVARMILMTGFLLGDIPFHTVYLHGLVRDAQGRKMSKSLGNIIDPLTMSEKYGADATRLSLLIGNAPGNDLKMSEDKIRGYRNFANKIWNASRFVITNTEEFSPATTEKINLTLRDKKILADVERLSKEITKDIENFRLYLAAEKTYHYFWHTFADNIIEEAKPRLKGTDTADKTSAERMLYETLITLLKLLHPFMPFVTEAVWEKVPNNKDSLLMVEKWPV
ncbi:MAG: valyl-tRNA synthetase [Parcubacteria group bacterium Gr01-1014_29]|nr:MAG: valyl-tRNA synthetase [Parcubacteria group bacterium Gr01-1014_29]